MNKSELIYAAAVNNYLLTQNPSLDAGVSPVDQRRMMYMNGTSMATPHVAGVAALMLARNPDLTPDEIEVLLKTTARPLPKACSVGCGKGIVSASAARRQRPTRELWRDRPACARCGPGRWARPTSGPGARRSRPARAACRGG